MRERCLKHLAPPLLARDPDLKPLWPSLDQYRLTLYRTHRTRNLDQGSSAQRCRTCPKLGYLSSCFSRWGRVFGGIPYLGVRFLGGPNNKDNRILGSILGPALSRKTTIDLGLSKEVAKCEARIGLVRSKY